VRGILVCLSFREELGVARNGSSGVPDDDVARGAESQRNPSLPGRAGLQGRHQVRCAGRSRVHRSREVEIQEQQQWEVRRQCGCRRSRVREPSRLYHACREPLHVLQGSSLFNSIRFQIWTNVIDIVWLHAYVKSRGFMTLHSVYVAGRRVVK
jgi:hypothetical protein